MAGSMRGAPAVWTDAGPPLKMTPAGLRARISSAVIVWGTISEYTWASRTRRAISWAYCAPKSTTRTVSKDWVMSSSEPVVRGFLGDHHVVRVALTEAGRGDLDEPAAGLQLLDGAGTAVAHGLAQPADELVQHVGQRPLVRDAALDALGHELAALDRALEVPVLGERPALHG